MKFLRLLSLTCSVIAAVSMTACGGGGERGPTWSQDLANTLAAPVLPPTDPGTVISSLPAGEYNGTCKPLFVGGVVPQSTITVLKVSEQSGGTYVSFRQDLYDNLSCSDDAYLGSITAPISRLAQRGEGVDAATGKPYVKVESTTLGGDVTFTVAPDAPLEVRDGTTSNTKLVVFTSSGLQLTEPSKVAPSTIKEIYAIIDGALYREDGTSAVSDGYATALNLATPLKPYKLFEVAPGVYAGQCQAIDLAGTGRLYGLMLKNTFEERGGDYRPRFYTTQEVYEDDDCLTGLLFSVDTPTVTVDTVGNINVNVNDDPAQPLLVKARQITLTSAAGTPVVTLDPDAQANGLVSVRQTADGPIVTLLTEQNRELQFDIQLAETTADLGYATLSGLFFGNPASVNPALSDFPTELLIDEPYNLLP